MSLYTRLTTGSSKIPVHTFMALLSELNRGAISALDIISILNLSPDEEASLNQLITKAQTMTAAKRFHFAITLHDMLLLAESGVLYTTEAEFNARISAIT